MTDKYMEWSDALSVDYPDIDEQHKKLVLMINDYYEQLSAGDHTSLTVLLTGLTEYTKFHFRFEEELMHQSTYPESAHHKHEHAALISRVNNITERVNAGVVAPTAEVANFIKSWLISHIMRTDKELAKWLREKK